MPAKDPVVERERAWQVPLEQIDPSKGWMFEHDTVGFYFERLRAEDPVHHVVSKRYGPYWSVTRYQDIMAVDTDHATYSSDAHRGGIALSERPAPEVFPSFIAMDPPKHDEQRKTVSPIVAPANLARLEGTIRERAGRILDGLPVGEPFDWVPRVSIELTTQMLATLFDFPFEDRRLLTRWSDMATGDPDGNGPVTSWEQRLAELGQCRDYFTRLWNQRVNAEPKPDLISMLAHAPATRHMGPDEFLGNLILLIVGGNDTTRNSISGGLLALNRFPAEYDKLRANPALVASLVPEIIRWQTPLAHMRRTALRDATLGSKTIRAGDKVVMWYLSGNRDGSAIERADEFVIDRARPRQHLSFGFGIHRCVGNRLAELQLTVLWQEILKRFPRIEVVGEPVRTKSNFVHGFVSLPVVIPERVGWGLPPAAGAPS
ncbi:MAG: cytochrome P450 [Burkholderiales bacterium]|nr:cytochrome P450 [Burkholderiales bacterium]